MGTSILVLNQPGVFLVDENGNVCTLDDGDTISNHEAMIIAGKDGTVARFMAVDSSGKLAIQNPPNLDAALSTLATETKLEACRALLQTIDADTSSLAAEDFATQTTLATLATETKLEAVRVLLASIDADTSNLDVALSTRLAENTFTTRINTQGQKTMAASTPVTVASDQAEFPVSQGTKGAGSNAWPTVLYDSAGNVVSVIEDNSIRRLETRSTLVGQTSGTGSEHKVSTILDVNDASAYRLKVEALQAAGSTVIIGSSIPPDPAALSLGFLEKSGGGESMLVDGSTPVAFSFTATTVSVSLYELLLVFTADDFNFDGASFGPNLPLTNGLKVQLTLDSTTTVLFTIKQNEDFLRVPGRLPLVNNTGPKDVLGAALQFGGGIILDHTTSDKIEVIVQDDMTSTKLKYLTGTLFGVEAS